MSTGWFSSKQFSNIKRAQSKKREQFKSREGEQWGKTWTRRLLALADVKAAKKIEAVTALSLPQSQLSVSSALHVPASQSALCSLQQCPTQLLLGLFLGPLPSSSFLRRSKDSWHAHSSTKVQTLILACFSVLWENQEQLILKLHFATSEESEAHF